MQLWPFAVTFAGPELRDRNRFLEPIEWSFSRALPFACILCPFKIFEYVKRDVNRIEAEVWRFFLFHKVELLLTFNYIKNSTKIV